MSPSTTSELLQWIALAALLLFILALYRQVGLMLLAVLVDQPHPTGQRSTWRRVTTTDQMDHDLTRAPAATSRGMAAPEPEWGALRSSAPTRGGSVIRARSTWYAAARSRAPPERVRGSGHSAVPTKELSCGERGAPY
jgi:hypothetical protein